MNQYFKFNELFKTLIPLWIILIGFGVLIGTSYAYLKPKVKSTITYSEQINNLQITYQAKSNIFSLKNAKPINDNKALSEAYEFIFTVKNIGNNQEKYNLYIEEIVNDIEFASVIKYSFREIGKDFSNIKILSQDNYLSKAEVLTKDEFKTYSLKLWLDQNANQSYQNQTFNFQIKTESLPS